LVWGCTSFATEAYGPLRPSENVIARHEVPKQSRRKWLNPQIATLAPLARNDKMGFSDGLASAKFNRAGSAPGPSTTPR